MYLSGDFYDGDWINGLKTGQGLYKFSNGDTYEGQWLKEKRHG